jgi:hypothetical protein
MSINRAEPPRETKKGRARMPLRRGALHVPHSARLAIS